VGQETINAIQATNHKHNDFQGPHHVSTMPADPENIALCKRTFAEYGKQTPLVVSSHGLIYREEECLDSGPEDCRISDSRVGEMDTPIKDLVAAGGDLEHIKSMICELSDELHPLFHENEKFCLDPTYASILKLTKGTPGYRELSWAPPLENVVLRAIMQLTSRIINVRPCVPGLPP
jgi:hypothetical protein